MTTREVEKRFNKHKRNQPHSLLPHILTIPHITFDNLKILQKENIYFKIILLEQLEILKIMDNQFLLNYNIEVNSKNSFKLVDS